MVIDSLFLKVRQILPKYQGIASQVMYPLPPPPPGSGWMLSGAVAVLQVWYVTNALLKGWR